MSWHETCRNKSGFSRYFSPDSNDRLSINVHVFDLYVYKLWYMKCGPLDNTVYRKCPIALNGQTFRSIAERSLSEAKFIFYLRTMVINYIIQCIIQLLGFSIPFLLDHDVTFVYKRVTLYKAFRTGVVLHWS